VDLARLGPASTGRRVETPRAPAVLYEDADLIAVAKPAGLPAHATADRSRDDLFSAVRRLLAARASHSGDAPLPYLGLHHRLDVDTSGVVLFSRQPRANAALGAQFAERTVEKVYHAIVHRPRRPLVARWRVEGRLAMEGTGRRARMAAVDQGGAAAATRFALLKTWDDALLVEARPETGRKHQVRAHLAGRQMPILGDTRYGGPDHASGAPVPRVMLHAARLAFTHPITAQPVTIECPYPEDFADLLRRLARAVRAPRR
jgi:RluA family pseudouridine synthase